MFLCFQVHQKQTERMKYRSEWFLSDPTGLVIISFLFVMDDL